MFVGLLSAAVAITLTVVGWELTRRLRRRDQERADLTEVDRLLRRLGVRIRLLDDQDDVLTAASEDCRTLRSLKYELSGVDLPALPEVGTVLGAVVDRLDAFLGTALPSHPAGTGTLTQARQQGRAAQEVLSAVDDAQDVVGRLRVR
ncbi:hypothetical protein [Streptomyces sp. NPDC046909]|uniref:hypothetical protein n=1 Tax=Streptomyces sp. NPDC046909 TaxID=3155617 RepID=UPI0033F70249